MDVRQVIVRRIDEPPEFLSHDDKHHRSDNPEEHRANEMSQRSVWRWVPTRFQFVGHLAIARGVVVAERRDHPARATWTNSRNVGES